MFIIINFIIFRSLPYDIGRRITQKNSNRQRETFKIVVIKIRIRDYFILIN